MDDSITNPEQGHAPPVRRANSLLLFIRDKATKNVPTNQSTLMFRTLTPALHLPNANRDYLAPLYARALMPLRYRFTHRSPSRVASVFRATHDPLYSVPGQVHFMDARTAWVDDICTNCIKQRGFTQVVIVAAGYDTRSTRLYQRGVKFFEIDLPHVSQKKKELTEKLIQSNSNYSKPVRRNSTNESMISTSSAGHGDDPTTPPSAPPSSPLSSTSASSSSSSTTSSSPPSPPPPPVFVGVDLSVSPIEEAMAQVDTFSTTEPTLFIVEGLIYYLEHADVAALFVGINKLSGPGSILCFDFMHSDAISGEKNYSGFDNLKTMCHLKGEDFKSGFDPSVDVIDGFLRKSGFKLDMMMVPREMVAEYLGHLEWNDEENPPICPYYSYVQAVHCPVSTAKAGLISM